jgi:hypothetical protein
MSCIEKSDQAGVILQPGKFGGDDTNILSAFGRLETGELFDRERVGPVIRHRAEVIQPVGVGHAPEIGGVLADLS